MIWCSNEVLKLLLSIYPRGMLEKVHVLSLGIQELLWVINDYENLCFVVYKMWFICSSIYLQQYISVKKKLPMRTLIMLMCWLNQQQIMMELETYLLAIKFLSFPNWIKLHLLIWLSWTPNWVINFQITEGVILLMYVAVFENSISELYLNNSLELFPRESATCTHLLNVLIW